MTQLGTDLLNGVQKSFAGYLMRDKDLKRIANRVRDGTDYEDANEYAVRVGELLAKSIDDNTQTLAYMSEEVARELLTPLLSETHYLVAGASAQVQKNMNNAAGIGLEALIPDLDTNRIDGLVNKVASYDTYDEARWVMHEPVVNYHQAIVDQAIRKNASAHSKAGFDAVIIRKTEAHKTVTGRKIIRGRAYPYKYTVPCKWCAGLEGVYKYKDVSNTGNDVFRRHEACRCTIIFKDGNRTIDVRTQREWTGEDAEEIMRRVQNAQAALNTGSMAAEVAKAEELKNGAYYPSEIAGVSRGEPMTVEEADSGRVNPKYADDYNARINCQSCVVAYEARLRGYDIEVLPYDKKVSAFSELAYSTKKAWLNADGTPAEYLIGSREEWKEMARTRTFYTPKTFEERLKNTLIPGARYDFGFPWKGRGNSGHIVTLDISESGVLHIYDPQCNKNYYGDEVSRYLNSIKFTRTSGGVKYPASVEVMRVDDKAFNLEYANAIMKAK